MNNDEESLRQLVLACSAQSPDPQQAAWWPQLIDALNDWLAHDFGRLVQLLYRMDVSEQKLKMLLRQQPGQDAAPIIARLMVEREAEKQESRRRHAANSSGSDEERW